MDEKRLFPRSYKNHRQICDRVAAAAKSLQSCLTLCDPTDGSPPGSPVPGILQARILEWAAISFSNACMHAKLLQSSPTLCDPMDSSPPGSSVHGFSRQEYWSGLPLPSPGDLPDQGLNPGLPHCGQTL